jgi:hypothetical protein
MWLFIQFRQIAPEMLDDNKLRELIKVNNNDQAAISLAIENIWQGNQNKWRIFRCVLNTGVMKFLKQ